MSLLSAWEQFWAEKRVPTWAGESEIDWMKWKIGWTVFRVLYNTLICWNACGKIGGVQLFLAALNIRWKLRKISGGTVYWYRKVET